MLDFKYTPLNIGAARLIKNFKNTFNFKRYTINKGAARLHKFKKYTFDKEVAGPHFSKDLPLIKVWPGD